MRMGFWWIFAGITLVVFLPCGLIVLAVVIIKHIIIVSETKVEKTENKPHIEEIIKNEYFENTLEKFR